MISKRQEYQRTLSESLSRLIEISNEYTIRLYEIRRKELDLFYSKPEQESVKGSKIKSSERTKP